MAAVGWAEPGLQAGFARARTGLGRRGAGRGLVAAARRRLRGDRERRQVALHALPRRRRRSRDLDGSRERQDALGVPLRGEDPEGQLHQHGVRQGAELHARSCRRQGRDAGLHGPCDMRRRQDRQAGLAAFAQQGLPGPIPALRSRLEPAVAGRPGRVRCGRPARVRAGQRRAGVGEPRPPGQLRLAPPRRGRRPAADRDASRGHDRRIRSRDGQETVVPRPQESMGHDLELTRRRRRGARLLFHLPGRGRPDRPRSRG